MSRVSRRPRSRESGALKKVLFGPHMLAFIPAIMLGGFWFGGELVLLTSAIILTTLMAVAGVVPSKPGKAQRVDPVTGLVQRETVVAALDEALADERTTGRRSACLVVEIDDFAAFEARNGSDAADKILRRVADRLSGATREEDILARIGKATFALALDPVRRMDLEILIQLSVRLQEAVSDPISLDASKVYLTASVGFCLPSRTPEKTGQAFLLAAETALNAAKANGPSSIRAYSSDLGTRRTPEPSSLEAVAEALERNEIRPWFQPQISTDTGRVTGFEALARWVHPERGVIPPSEFLPAIEAAGLNARLGEIVLFHSLTALRAWDRAGLEVPRVAVNFSGAELSDPRLIERIRWELDRFDLSPDRLAVEVLETVVSKSENDTITRNLASLARMGCLVELDDFGTGNASLAAIRRFAVHRIKIDRSFVTKVDVDRHQQDMVAAILTMAERLRLDTVAEGVETVGEHAMLAQLGCQSVQGYSIGKPMPFEDTLAWMTGHAEKLTAPQLGREAS